MEIRTENGAVSAVVLATGAVFSVKAAILATGTYLTGRTIIGERCWDVSRAIDVVEANFPMIDMGRICVMGNSGGGRCCPFSPGKQTARVCADCQRRDDLF